MNLKLVTAGLSPLLLAMGIALSVTGSGALNPVANTAGCLPALDPTAQITQAVKDLTPTALGHAKTIYDVSVKMKLPPRAAVVALATALQESYLKNMANSNVPKSLTLPHEGVGADHDSVGLFQQRPLPPDGEGGWGTVEELMTPKTSAMKFYSALRRIDSWEQLPITVAAQRVQISAFPDAYAKHEPLATALATSVGSGRSWANPDGLEQCPSSLGWAHPVPGYKVNSGFRTADRPSHDGVDIAAPKGTPIRAAASGVVIKVRCNASLDGGDYSCDQDGSPAVAGCGHYLEIRSGEHIHRYCHLLRKPPVLTGQAVQVGQVVGFVGSSGNSSGPHLHWELHRGPDASSRTAIDPVVFMRQMGVVGF